LNSIEEIITDLEQRKSALEVAINSLRATQGNVGVLHRHVLPQIDSPAPVKLRKAKVAGSKPGRPRPLVTKLSPSGAIIPEVPATPIQPSDGLQIAILKAVSGSSLTSIQTFEMVRKHGIGTTSGSVYQTLRNMAERKLVEKFVSDDGVVSWKRLEQPVSASA